MGSEPVHAEGWSHHLDCRSPPPRFSEPTAGGEGLAGTGFTTNRNRCKLCTVRVYAKAVRSLRFRWRSRSSRIGFSAGRTIVREGRSRVTREKSADSSQRRESDPSAVSAIPRHRPSVTNPASQAFTRRNTTHASARSIAGTNAIGRQQFARSLADPMRGRLCSAHSDLNTKPAASSSATVSGGNSFDGTTAALSGDRHASVACPALAAARPVR